MSYTLFNKDNFWQRMSENFTDYADEQKVISEIEEIIADLILYIATDNEDFKREMVSHMIYKTYWNGLTDRYQAYLNKTLADSKEYLEKYKEREANKGY